MKPSLPAYAICANADDNAVHAARAHGASGASGWLAEQLLGPDQAMQAVHRAQIPYERRGQR